MVDKPTYKEPEQSVKQLENEAADPERAEERSEEAPQESGKRYRNILFSKIPEILFAYTPNKAEQVKILIVDDDKASAMIIEGYLQRFNYHIHIVDNGIDALKWAKKFKPDLIFLDIMMPGISGFEVCERLKKDKTTQDIPVLFITALSDSDSHKKAIELGGEGFIRKPFNEDFVKAYVKLFIT